METVEHVFSEGSQANSIWKYWGSIFGINISSTTSWKIKCLLWWSKSKGFSQDCLLAQIAHLVITWELWLVRNARKYSEKFNTMDLNIRNIRKWIIDLNALVSPKTPISFQDFVTLSSLNVSIKQVRIKKSILEQWTIPIQNMLKLNIDGASKGNPEQSGCGGVLKCQHYSQIYYSVIR